MTVTFKRFEDLSLKELYQILALRNEVFVVEQNCPYQDIDGKDQEAIHHLYKTDEELVAYLRIIPGRKVRIGRVVVAQPHRNKGIARKIMLTAFEEIARIYPGKDINLQAQTYLQQFYEDLGFSAVSEAYLEDDIPHVDMVKQPLA